MDQRILNLYTALAEGKVIYKQEEADRYKVSLRTIQRDLEELRLFFADDAPETGIARDVVYDRQQKGYVLDPPIQSTFTNSEIFTISKILLESRSLNKKELEPIITKLIGCCYPSSDQRLVADLLQNERFHYIEPHHKKRLINKIWDLGHAVHKHQVVKVQYFRHYDGKTVTRILRPVGIMCSEYYFYLLAFYDESDEIVSRKGWSKQDYPISYRIDRMLKYQVLDQQFKVPYADRFEEGEFRKRVQFMFSGALATVKFWCSRVALEAIQDRLPTAEVVKPDKDGLGYYIKAEAYGDGVEMWLRSQGDNVRKVKLKYK